MDEKKTVSNFDRIMRDEIYMFSVQSERSLALADFLDAFRTFPILFKRAFSELKLKYSRSVFGPLWETATVIVFVLGFAIVGGMIFGGDRTTYVAYLTGGIVFWQFISVNISESSGLFIRHNSEIQTRKTSFCSLLVTQLLRSVFIIMHNIPLLFIVVAVTGNLKWSIIYFIPGMLLILLMLLPLGLILAMATARFRDLQYAISMVMQFMFYMTPIFWPASSIKGYPNRLLLDLNPFYHMLDILRGPFMGDPINLWSFGILSLATLAMYAIAAIIFGRFRKRIVYWL